MPDRKPKAPRRNRDIQTGDQVVVLRDIYRVPNPKDVAEREAFWNQRTYFRWAQDYGWPTCEPPCNTHTLYAKAGEQGKVIDMEYHRCVKVLIGDEIKTFRVTTLARLGSTSEVRP